MNGGESEGMETNRSPAFLVRPASATPNDGGTHERGRTGGRTKKAPACRGNTAQAVQGGEIDGWPAVGTARREGAAEALDGAAGQRARARGDRTAAGREV